MQVEPAFGRFDHQIPVLLFRGRRHEAGLSQTGCRKSMAERGRDKRLETVDYRLETGGQSRKTELAHAPSLKSTVSGLRSTVSSLQSLVYGL